MKSVDRSGRKCTSGSFGCPAFRGCGQGQGRHSFQEGSPHSSARGRPAWWCRATPTPSLNTGLGKRGEGAASDAAHPEPGVDSPPLPFPSHSPAGYLKVSPNPQEGAKDNCWISMTCEQKLRRFRRNIVSTINLDKGLLGYEGLKRDNKIIPHFRDVFKIPQFQNVLDLLFQDQVSTFTGGPGAHGGRQVASADPLCVLCASGFPSWWCSLPAGRPPSAVSVCKQRAVRRGARRWPGRGR